MKKNQILEILGDTILVSAGVVFTYQFVTIALLGWYGTEPNRLVLAAEILMGVFIFVLGINRFFHDVRRFRGRR